MHTQRQLDLYLAGRISSAELLQAHQSDAVDEKLCGRAERVKDKPLRSNRTVNFGEAEQKDICQMYVACDMSIEQIATVKARSSTVIRRVLLQNGVRIKDRGRKLKRRRKDAGNQSKTKRVVSRG